MTRLRAVCFLIAMILFMGCSTTNINANYAQTISSWRWAKTNQLLKIWGNPDQIVTLPNQNRIYIYNKEIYKSYPAPSTITPAVITLSGNGRGSVVSPTSYQPQRGASYLLNCLTSFEIDPRNVIVDVRAAGNNCTADEGFFNEKAYHPE